MKWVEKINLKRWGEVSSNELKKTRLHNVGDMAFSLPSIVAVGALSLIFDGARGGKKVYDHFKGSGSSTSEPTVAEVAPVEPEEVASEDEDEGEDHERTEA